LKKKKTKKKTFVKSEEASFQSKREDPKGGACERALGKSEREELKIRGLNGSGRTFKRVGQTCTQTKKEYL